MPKFHSPTPHAAINVADYNNNKSVDFFIANSKYIQKRIKKNYNRNSKVIYPPVDISKFKLKVKKEDFFFTASRLVSYKKIEIIIRAFNELHNKKLIIAGSGPEEKKLKKIAKDNIEFLGYI